MSDPLREQLARVLDWNDAHVGFDAAVDGIGPAHRGVVPEGMAHSAWQLLEHLRIAQHDILDFCVNASYKEMTWPDDYWPADPQPPSEAAWDDAVAGYVRDRDAVKRLARDQKVDLHATIPHGSGQTYLREILLVADHAAYHVGQIVVLRRLLGIWPAVGA
jgi:uncharacterized damage-inducible protein DinB